MDKKIKEVLISAICDACWREDSDHAMLRRSMDALLKNQYNEVSDEFYSLIVSNMYAHHVSSDEYHKKKGRHEARINLVKKILDLGRDIPEIKLLWFDEIGIGNSDLVKGVLPDFGEFV